MLSSAVKVALRDVVSPFVPPMLAMAVPPAAAWLLPVMDEVDHGLVLLDAAGTVLHLNHSARTGLQAGGLLQVMPDGRLAPDHPDDLAAWQRAIDDAQCRGLRTLVCLGGRPALSAVSVVPVDAGFDDGDRCVLLGLPRARIGSRLALQAWSRAHGLSPAEEQVLDALCLGMTPSQIATRHVVALSTVRTQIASIRLKTGAATIDALIRQVATLPPMVETLHRWQTDGLATTMAHDRKRRTLARTVCSSD